ncbi:hypothetical protein F3157_09045 [Virgibacillus dakarensis]|nr:hypothetical protein [Virgibacillus dakarensis]
MYLDEGLPEPGGTEFHGEWTTVDLSDKGILLMMIYTLVYIQTKPHRYAPALAADESSPHNGRSWHRISYPLHVFGCYLDTFPL